MAQRNGTLFVNVAGTWKRAETIHPYGRDATTWRDPFELWATDGTDWYGSWPWKPPADAPPPTNMRVTALSSSSFTVAWDAPARTPLRYWLNVSSGISMVTTGLTITVSGLAPATAYVVEVIALYPDGISTTAALTVTTGSTTPPTITGWAGVTYSQANIVVAGTAPFTLRCVGGARNGQTWPIASAGTTALTALSGTEYWQVENAGGVTSRFYTVAGTPAQGAVVGSILTTLFNPTGAFGRGSSYGIDWGVPAMAAHASFPYSNINDGSGATRFQTGNYPRGWVQFQVGVETGYRVRRFAFMQGDGAGNTEVVTPAYSVDGGATFWRWSHAFGQWFNTANDDPSGTSPNGLLSISSQGSWDRDWNWRLTDNGALYTPYINEVNTDLTQRWIYLRWGIVHLGGSFGANCGECWMEYQTPSTPARAEVVAGIAWG